MRFTNEAPKDDEVISLDEQLFEKLRANKKYSDVCPDTVKRIILECESRYRKPKDMEKAVREKLHGLTGAYNDLQGVSAADAARISDDADLENILRCHVSTRERLPIANIDRMYARIFETTGEPQSILDLACGLNPVYLANRRDCPITAVDISRKCILMLEHTQVKGIWGDLLCEGGIPSERFHLALMFKLLPLLERQRAGAASDVMDAVNAEYLIISFPTRTMGGRAVGMEAHYAQWMENHLPKGRIVAAKYVFGSELFYILKEN